MVQSRGSRGVPRWLVVAGGVALGLVLVGAYAAANLPPEASEMIRASYGRGFQAGAGSQGQAAAREVRRTPLTSSTGT